MKIIKGAAHNGLDFEYEQIISTLDYISVFIQLKKLTAFSDNCPLNG